MIEDDESIHRELTALLRANGYETVDSPPCDLALLDVNLPGESGFELCRKLRQHSDVPVIFLTARDSAEDEILGFGVGADDYIRKPYHSSVLLARMARLLKRHSSLVACLMQKGLCTKDEIVEDLWQNSLYIDENTLYVNVNRLREKLSRLGAEDYIRTVRGVGYRL